MKTWILIWLAVCSAALAQSAATLSQQEALQKYPELADQGSKFNARFREKLTRARANADPRLGRDDWPMVLAAEVAAEPQGTMLDKPGSTDLSRPQTGHEAANPLAVVAGRVTISGTVFQRTKDGLLVDTRKARVWLSGLDAKDGQKITVPAVKTEPHSYTTVTGAEKMVDGYQALK